MVVQIVNNTGLLVTIKISCISFSGHSNQLESLLPVDDILINDTFSRSLLSEWLNDSYTCCKRSMEGDLFFKTSLPTD